jgi:hypothetical protein
MKELGLNDAADALIALRDELDAESVIAFFATPNGDVAIVADEDGAAVTAHGQMLPLTGRP